MGIVGLPNVGKSTLFNVLTRLGIPAENFPFCTIEPVPYGHDAAICQLSASGRGAGGEAVPTAPSICQAV